MNFKNNTILEKISFGISILILLCTLEVTFHDIIFPLDFDNPSSSISFYDQYQNLITILLMLIALVNFILGIITLFQKGSNKKLAVTTIIICTPLALPCIIGYTEGIMMRLGIL